MDDFLRQSLEAKVNWTLFFQIVVFAERIDPRVAVEWRPKSIDPASCKSANRPDDPNLPNFLKQVESILAWRAAVPPDDRFWKADVP